MVATDLAREIFADARAMYESAVEQLGTGDMRDAAEKAWCATLRATNALLLARTGEEPLNTVGTSGRLDQLVRQDPAVRILVGRYYARQIRLHKDCYHSGILIGEDEIERRIRETIEYITDAEKLTLNTYASPQASTGK